NTNSQNCKGFAPVLFEPGSRMIPQQVPRSSRYACSKYSDASQHSQGCVQSRLYSTCDLTCRSSTSNPESFEGVIASLQSAEHDLASSPGMAELLLFSESWK
ncbi:uncharacterized protein N7506_003992, partial [Penicillium brevicompactum]|uniref:uncharacterized protein n=1 Tax=Penicillium brevicompactum TaxID=5074 RepID=UPI00253FC78A